MAIVLPGGARVPARPGKYRIAQPPDLNKVEEDRFFLEYDYPFLLVREIALSSEEEKGNAIAQAQQWKTTHCDTGGKVGYDRTGYQFGRSPSRYARGYRQQFIPDMSYIDARTWSRLSDADKEKAYRPCVPVVVVELMLGTDSIEDLQAKVARFIAAGCREGIIVDTKRDRVWIHNQNQRPYFAPLAPIEFEWWPGFTLDCIAIRDARGARRYQSDLKWCEH